ncbi:helix-turn-helix transcriptional regulator, partial [Lactobacillus crispatus]
MLGYARDDVFGRSLAEVGLLNGVEKAETIQERLAEGRTIPQTEVQLPLRSGGSKLVILAGQPIEIGDDACMLFTFADLDARAKAESALRQSEERFAKSFQLSPVPTALLRMDGHTFLMVNEAFVAQFGHTSAELIGRSLG